MNGFNKPMLQGGPPQQGGTGGPPGPRQGPPQVGPGGGGQQVPDWMQGLSPSAPIHGASNAYAGRERHRGNIADLQRQLMFAQNSGASPNVIGDLQMQLQSAMQQMQDWQTSEYATQMGQMSRQGLGAVGGGPGNRSQLQQNPYLQMLLQSVLGMGGGGSGGGPYGPQMG